MMNDQINTEHTEISENPELDELYLRLGKAYYEERENDPLPSLINLFDQISTLLNEPEISVLICPNCHAQFEEDIAFCPHCGTKLKP